MKRKNWFRKSRKQSKPQDKPAEEYSVDEILTEFRRDYVEPEDETMEQDRPVEESEDDRTVLQEEETQTEEIEEEKTGAPEEDVVYSVHDILRDYRLMTMESRYKEDNLEQEEKTETELPDDYTLKTNRNMLRRTLNCLMENAVKYTQKGSITIRSKEDGELLKIAIEDTGSGIPEHEAEHIFDRFVKLDNFKEGIGLGLSFSRQLAQQLGGNVELDTTYKDGARFIVTLPKGNVN